jgi:hypothetical protein
LRAGGFAPGPPLFGRTQTGSLTLVRWGTSRDLPPGLRMDRGGRWAGKVHGEGCAKKKTEHAQTCWEKEVAKVGQGTT